MQWKKPLCSVVLQIEEWLKGKKSSSRGIRDFELFEGLYIEEIQGNTRGIFQLDLLGNDIPVSFKLDTGAEYNVISLGLGNELNAQVQPTSMMLKLFWVASALILCANAFLIRW